MKPAPASSKAPAVLPPPAAPAAAPAAARAAKKLNVPLTSAKKKNSATATLEVKVHILPQALPNPPAPPSATQKVKAPASKQTPLYVMLALVFVLLGILTVLNLNSYRQIAAANARMKKPAEVTKQTNDAETVKVEATKLQTKLNTAKAENSKLQKRLEEIDAANKANEATAARQKAEIDAAKRAMRAVATPVAPPAPALSYYPPEQPANSAPACAEPTQQFFAQAVGGRQAVAFVSDRSWTDFTAHVNFAGQPAVRTSHPLSVEDAERVAGLETDIRSLEAYIEQTKKDMDGCRRLANNRGRGDNSVSQAIQQQADKDSEHDRKLLVKYRTQLQQKRTELQALTSQQ